MAQGSMIFLDSHETSRISAPVVERVRLALSERKPAGTLDVLYELVGAEAEDSFSCTSSGAEAINQVHWSAFLEIARKEGKCHFLTTPVEDFATLQSLKRLEELGCFVKIMPLDSHGRIDLAKLPELITPRTALLSFSLAHPLTGVIQPAEEIVQMAHAAGALVHVDATHALGKLYQPFALVGADYLTFGGEGIHAIPGSGGVFAKKGRPLVPLVLGSRPDAVALAALGTAASHAALFFDQMGLEVARLRDRLEAGLVGAKPLLQDSFRLPNVTLLAFPKVHQEALQYLLQQKGVAASIGGVSLGFLYRHLLQCGFDEHTARSACSFSLSRFTTQEDVDLAVVCIQAVVKGLLPLTEDLFSC